MVISKIPINSFSIFSLSAIHTQVLELTDVKWRSRLWPLMQIGIPVGQLVLAVTTGFIEQRQSRQQLCLTLLQFLPLFWTWFLPESPGWQLMNSRFEKAEKQLMSRARSRGKLTESQVRLRLHQLREQLIQDELARTSARNRVVSRSTCCGSWSSCVVSFLLSLLWTTSSLFYFLTALRPTMLAGLPQSTWDLRLSTQLPQTDLLSLLGLFVSIRLGFRRLYLLVLGFFVESVGLVGMLLFNHLSSIGDQHPNHLIRLLFLMLARAAATFSLATLCVYTGERYQGWNRFRYYCSLLQFFVIGGCLAALLPDFVSKLKNRLQLIIFFIFYWAFNRIQSFLKAEKLFHQTKATL